MAPYSLDHSKNVLLIGSKVVARASQLLSLLQSVWSNLGFLLEKKI